MTEVEKLQEWYDKGRANGLLDFRVSIRPDTTSPKLTDEELAVQINTLLISYEKGNTTQYSDY